MTVRHLFVVFIATLNFWKLRMVENIKAKKWFNIYFDLKPLKSQIELLHQVLHQNSAGLFLKSQIITVSSNISWILWLFFLCWLRYGPVGLVHVDAHADTSDVVLGEKIGHGTPFRRCVEEGLLDCQRVVQIGLRGSGYSADSYEWSRAQVQSGILLMW